MSPITNIESQYPILLFDGVCNLCNQSVQWVLKHDQKAQFRFVSLQSETSQRLLKQYNLNSNTLDSVVLIHHNKAYIRSDVPLETARLLGGFWQLTYIFKLVPSFLRDRVYQFIAANRYRWFGKEESCWLPAPKWKNRFLEI